ncbi:MAG: nuclear transport factor 2 family protein [Candidatus Eremiobacteraeota bacterium]|nr:nuclear transport factor 2 family protein [Candidatus Eremiobacteraeota bacterium]NNM92973.1 nuclear transport factor 2 family protein [Candidatus Eremiobacteraeota bacterium]
MLIFKHILLAAATALSPSLYRTQCSALVAGNLPEYAATLAPSYRFVDLGGRVESRAQVLATFANWFRTKAGSIERCRASAPSTSPSATSLSLPLHIVEDISVAIPTEGVRRYRIDLHAIERWRLLDGQWRAVESVVRKRSVTPL